jgi:hypothetical protein
MVWLGLGNGALKTECLIFYWMGFGGGGGGCCYCDFSG